MGDDLTLGLTLSGGGAYGAAQAGVLQVLEERGIRPGIVAGTSAGALIGAAYAARLDADAIESAVRRFRWSHIARWSARPRWGVLDTHAVTDAVHRILGEDPMIEDLPRRFGAYATDLRTRRGVILDHGPLSSALRATIAVPGLLPPVRRSGRLLADGGMIDNVPDGVTRALGATRTIIVRLHAKWENVRMMRTTAATADLVADPTVILIQPDMVCMAQWVTKDVPRLIAEGRRAAEEGLDAAVRDGRLLTAA